MIWVIHMRIDLIDLRKSDDRKIFNKLQPIINENTVINGGNLRQGALFDKDFDWSHLFIVRDDNKIVGFAILRYSNYDQHYTGFDEYYYISDMVLLKKYQKQGIGTKLLQMILNSIDDLPIVASVRVDNEIALKMLSKNMKAFYKKKNYYRFIDKQFAKLRDESISSGFRL